MITIGRTDEDRRMIDCLAEKFVNDGIEEHQARREAERLFNDYQYFVRLGKIKAGRAIDFIAIAIPMQSSLYSHLQTYYFDYVYGKHTYDDAVVDLKKILFE